VDVVFQNYVSRDKLVDVFPNQSMEKMVGVIAIDIESRQDETRSHYA
jgi:hypothetical protein